MVLLTSFGFTSAWEYHYSYSYGNSHAYAKVIGEYPSCDGRQVGGYCVGNYIVNVDYSGDKFYMGYSYNSFSPTFSSSGVSGIPRSSSGKKVLPLKNGQPKCYILYAWDYNKASNGDWSWTAKGGGYLCDVFSGLKVINCYSNSDCNSGMICDKSNSFTDWKCVIPPCQSGQTKCVGNDYYSCESYNWKNKGKILNKCGIECLGSSDCEKVEGEPFCKESFIQYSINTPVCLSYKCQDSITYKTKENCEFGCLNGECKEEPNVTFYRLENKQCSKIEIKASEKTNNDFLTLNECNELRIRDLNFFQRIWDWIKVLFKKGN